MSELQSNGGALPFGISGLLLSYPIENEGTAVFASGSIHNHKEEYVVRSVMSENHKSTKSRKDRQMLRCGNLKPRVDPVADCHSLGIGKHGSTMLFQEQFEVMGYDFRPGRCARSILKLLLDPSNSRNII